MPFFIGDSGASLSTIWNGNWNEHLFFKVTAATGPELTAVVKSTIHSCCLFEHDIQNRHCGEKSWVTVLPSIVPTKLKPTGNDDYSSRQRQV